MLSGRFESKFKNVLPGSRFSNNGKFCKSLCCSHPIGTSHPSDVYPIFSPLSVKVLFPHFEPSSAKPALTLNPLIKPICVSGGGLYS